MLDPLASDLCLRIDADVAFMDLKTIYADGDLTGIKVGIARYGKELVYEALPGNEPGRWFKCLFLMIGWWFWQSITVYNPTSWWDPLHVYSVGTCIFQWGIVLDAFFLIN